MNTGGLGLGDLMKLAGQAGKIRERMDQVQERAARATVQGEAAGGLVKATANGMGELLTVTVDPEVLKDPEDLGPLIVAAVNTAMRKSKETLREEFREALGGIDLPAGIPGF